ncbi:hypothetical protein KUCAC02_029982, partial [Chaenocephalus aceratus]
EETMAQMHQPQVGERKVVRPLNLRSEELLTLVQRDQSLKPPSSILFYLI